MADSVRSEAVTALSSATCNLEEARAILERNDSALDGGRRMLWDNRAFVIIPLFFRDHLRAELGALCTAIPSRTQGE